MKDFFKEAFDRQFCLTVTRGIGAGAAVLVAGCALGSFCAAVFFRK